MVYSNHRTLWGNEIHGATITHNNKAQCLTKGCMLYGLIKKMLIKRTKLWYQDEGQNYRGKGNKRDLGDTFKVLFFALGSIYIKNF